MIPRVYGWRRALVWLGLLAVDVVCLVAIGYAAGWAIQAVTR
jgi:hypothetical protein